MAREVRPMTGAEWDAFCAAFAAAPPPNDDDTGIQDAETGREVSPEEYLIRTERARRERQLGDRPRVADPEKPVSG